MKRTVTKTVLSETSERIRVKLEKEDSVFGSEVDTFLLFELLRQIADSPDLTACGLERFHTLKIYHNGQRWVAEAEATVNIDPKR